MGVVCNIDGIKIENRRLSTLNTELEKNLDSAKNEIQELNEKLKIMEKNNFNNFINNKINIDPKTNQYVFNRNQNNENDPLKFYDVIVYIQSIKGIIKGWKIKLSEKFEKEYNKQINEKIVKIGIIGNSNKGKSFILSKISKINLPSGTSIKTEGLSIKYPDLKEFKDRRIVLIDSAGLETPVLKDDNENYELNNNKANKSKDNEKSEKKSPSIHSIANNEKNNDEISIQKNLNDIFKEKSRDKIITELFLQNYIIHISDILIIVVGILTYSEQKLLNKIKTEMKRAKIYKDFYIIHNLMTFTARKQVEEYIKETLLNSATFNLEKHIMVTTQKIEEKGEYYFEKEEKNEKNEKNEKPNNQKIFHLIFANEGSEAGNYYNEYTLKFIEGLYSTLTNFGGFDYLKTIKDRFKELSKDIIEKVEDEIVFDESKNSHNIIKLIKPEKIILKKCLIDELGFSNLKVNGFEPTYNYYKDDNNNIVVRIEAPGNCDLISNVDFHGEYTIIKINGIKRQDNEPVKLENNIFNSREIGKFFLEIPLKIEENFIKLNEEPNILKKNGLIIVTYKLEKSKINKQFKQKKEDEV